MVPRVHDETFAHAPAEHLVRLAIAQAIYDDLFESHPQQAVDLNVHGPLWDGELETGQWRHGVDAGAPEPLAACESPRAKAQETSQTVPLAAATARSQLVDAEADNMPEENPQAPRGVRALV